MDKVHTPVRGGGGPGPQEGAAAGEAVRRGAAGLVWGWGCTTTLGQARLLHSLALSAVQTPAYKGGLSTPSDISRQGDNI